MVKFLACLLLICKVAWYRQENRRLEEPSLETKPDSIVVIETGIEFRFISFTDRSVWLGERISSYVHAPGVLRYSTFLGYIRFLLQVIGDILS